MGDTMMNTTEGTPKAEIVSTPRDLFNHIDELPDKVMDLLNSKDECDSYEDCNTLIAELNELGYTMDYDLDAVGYNLRLITEEHRDTLKAQGYGPTNNNN